MSLDNKTPAQMSGIKFYGTWEDLMRSALTNTNERALAVKEY